MVQRDGSPQASYKRHRSGIKTDFNPTEIFGSCRKLF